MLKGFRKYKLSIDPKTKAQTIRFNDNLGVAILPCNSAHTAYNLEVLAYNYGQILATKQNVPAADAKAARKAGIEFAHEYMTGKLNELLGDYKAVRDTFLNEALTPPVANSALVEITEKSLQIETAFGIRTIPELLYDAQELLAGKAISFTTPITSILGVLTPIGPQHPELLKIDTSQPDNIKKVRQLAKRLEKLQDDYKSLK